MAATAGDDDNLVQAHAIVAATLRRSHLDCYRKKKKGGGQRTSYLKFRSKKLSKDKRELSEQLAAEEYSLFTWILRPYQ